MMEIRVKKINETISGTFRVRGRPGGEDIGPLLGEMK